jgi:A/G-specific adenine glycosylase
MVYGQTSKLPRRKLVVDTAVVEARIRNLRAVQRTLLEWHAGRALQAPWRMSGDPYQCLVAAVMAQQTQMSRVLPSYERFMAVFPTVESLARASRAEVIRAWAGMGYNQRAVRLHNAARTIATGGWPHDAASLERIDGIGPFTAAIIASFSFGEASACVDTNVRRVLGRLAGDDGIDGAALQRLADASLASEAPARWNQAVMDYGATVCVARPKCGECVVSRWCASRESFVAPRAVADQRATYETMSRPRVKREAPYEGSARFYRGRIIDVLCGLAPGESVSLRRLPAVLANGALAPDAGLVRELCVALEREGLAEVRRGRVALPE